MHKRLYIFLHNFDILYPFQFGLRPKHSTSLTLIGVIERIRSVLDTGDNAIGICLDIKKAFDS